MKNQQAKIKNSLEIRLPAIFLIFQPSFLVGWLALGHDVRRFQYYVKTLFPFQQRLEVANTLEIIII